MSNIGNPAIIVFLKPPIIGKVKTRLAASIGDHQALQIYRHLLRHTFHILNHSEAEVFLFLTEKEKKGSLSFRLPNSHVLYQSGEDLGMRMKNAFEKVFQWNFGPVIIIGTDNIEIRPKHLRQAFNALQSNDVTIGPSNDGGYYLLGMNSFQSQLFDDIAWSSSVVLKQSIEKIINSGLSLQLLSELVDIDEYKDLEACGWQTVLENLKLRR